MKELLDTLGAYNIFNYLLPGVVFSAFSGLLTEHKVTQSDIITELFVCYFIGMVISRVGSLFIEPVLKRLKFLKFSTYKDYVSASKNDQLILTLSEANNVYRTVVSLLFCLVLLRAYYVFLYPIAFFKEWGISLLVMGLMILFLLAYRKQTAYIFARVQENISKD